MPGASNDARDGGHALKTTPFTSSSIGVTPSHDIASVGGSTIRNQVHIDLTLDPTSSTALLPSRSVISVAEGSSGQGRAKGVLIDLTLDDERESGVRDLEVVGKRDVRPGILYLKVIVFSAVSLVLLP